MRVLAVGEVGDLPEGERELVREELVLGEPAGDRGVVGGRDRERLGGERPPRLDRERAVAELGEHRVVLLGAADGGDVREVLRGAAKERGAADVDHLDDVRLLDPEPSGDRRERVEVDADEVERLDPVLGQRGRVLLAIAARKDARVDRRGGAS